MMRWPRRRWGYVITCTEPGRDPLVDTATRRFWTRGGAATEALDQWRAYVATVPQAGWSVEVKQMPPVPNVYADKYWRGDIYVGPEV